MSETNYEVQNKTVSSILHAIEDGEIGLPEIQRPFVWKSKQVRDLIDSLYHGFPIGYIITWQNPEVILKDGTHSTGKKIIIDGQQRTTALKAAIVGQKVLDDNFKSKRIKIAFNPATEEFATLTPAISKDVRWINDISEVFNGIIDPFDFIPSYVKNNNADQKQIRDSFKKLDSIQNNALGNIILSASLDIEQVTEIFNRINSQGTKLSSADFVMSKLASDEEFGGANIRRKVEYFCRLLIDHSAINEIKNDEQFAKTQQFKKIQWIAEEESNLYMPKFGDVFHTVLAYKFLRGKLSDLVALVSGRDFETRTYTQEAMENAYKLLNEGIDDFTNESNFKRFIMIMKSMGMLKQGSLALDGKNLLNFCYALFLLLYKQKKYSQSEIEHIIKRWLVFAAITGRYNSAPESTTGKDIKRFADGDAKQMLVEMERQELNADFWEFKLPSDILQTSSSTNKAWKIFQMAQVKDHDVAWLEDSHQVESLIEEQGNIHHIFPKAFLKKNGIGQSAYNQVANYVWLTQPRNLLISDHAPIDYLHNDDVLEFSNDANWEANAIPKELKNMKFEDYQHFLTLRRQLIAQRIKKYYQSL